MVEIAIAGLRIRFEGNAGAISMCRERYAAFEVAPAGEPTVVIAVRQDGDPLPEEPGPEEVFRPVVSEGQVALAGAGVRAVIDPERRRATVEGLRGQRPVDAVLRYLLAHHLLARGGLLVHASAVVLDERAWVFAGVSGAGKSTIFRELAAAGAVPLSDEAIALAPRADGWNAWATPFWNGRPRRAPLAGIAFPGHVGQPGSSGGNASFSRLRPARAMALLVSCAGPLLAGDAPAVLVTSESLVRRVPCTSAYLSSIGDIRDWLQPRLYQAVRGGRS